MSYEAGLLMNPVGEGADSRPSKLGFPPAETAWDASRAAATVSVPARPVNPPARFRVNALPVFICLDLSPDVG
jgi:hypothetical protein